MILKHKKVIILLSIILSLSALHIYRNRDLVTTYTSEYQGFTITFPASWHGKYKVIEKEDSITVCLNKFGCIDLFTITTDMSDTLDSIPNVEKIETIKGKQYQIGGPTGLPYSEFTSANTRTLYARLEYDVPKVISSIQ